MNAISSVASEVTTAAPSYEVTEYVVEEITARYAKAQRPVVVVDACAGRFGMAGEVRKLVEGSGLRFFESAYRSQIRASADCLTYST